MGSRGRRLLVVLTLLAGASCIVLAGENIASRQHALRSEQFQRLVGGLGFGPALDLSGCAFGFDPRLDGSCSEDSGPLPGGACFCPRHAGAVFEYAPLNQGQGDALPP
jgi:hypothetical protein